MQVESGVFFLANFDVLLDSCGSSEYIDVFAGTFEYDVVASSSFPWRQ